MSTLATRAGQLAGPPPNIVWLNAGHGGNTDDNTYDPGAPVNWPDGRQTTEAELVANFVRDVVEKVVALGNPAPKVLNHGGAPAPVKFWELTQKLKSAGKPGEYLISYHTNSAAKKDWHRVSGTETLYAITSATGERLAKALTETTTSVLGMRTPRKNLGIWGVKERGGLILIETPQFAALHELAFCCNPTETGLVSDKWDDLVKAHARLIIQIMWEGI